MRYPEGFLEELCERTDLVETVSRYVSLTKRGSNYVGLCPFHNEKTPSFSVAPSRQFYHCFGCGVGGDVISFVMRVENLDFPDAVRVLAERAGMLELWKLTPAGAECLRALAPMEDAYAVHVTGRTAYLVSPTRFRQIPFDRLEK